MDEGISADAKGTVASVHRSGGDKSGDALLDSKVADDTKLFEVTRADVEERGGRLGGGLAKA